MDRSDNDSDCEGAEDEKLFKNVFSMMDQADKALSQLGNEQILLVGLSRIGKSTSHNWITGSPMIGQMINGQVSYVNIGQEGSPVNAGINSMTLIANKRSVDGVDILDMAGFGDTRSHIGVFGVSYCLKKVFESGKKFKFILVISENALMAPGSNDVIRTFNHFFEMFKIRDMTPEVKAAFYNSISLLVTRTVDQYRQTDIIESIVKGLENPTNNIRGRERIVELMKILISTNRIKVFKQAQTNLSASKCEMIKELNFLGWSYFELQRFNEAENRSFVALPFSREYDRLGRKQQRKFDAAITNRMDSYTQFTQILREILDIGMLSGHSLEVEYTNSFIKIENFLDKEDHYDSEKEISREELSAVPVKLANIELHKSLRRLTKMTRVEIKKYNQSIQVYMKYLEGVCDDILNGFLKMICSSEREEMLIIRLRYVIRRGFTQFLTINSIDPSKGADAYSRIYDSLNNSVQHVDLVDFAERFFVGTPFNKMILCFPTLEQRKMLDDYLKEYEDEVGENMIKSKNEFREMSYLLKRRICLDSKNCADYRNAIKYALEGIKNLLKKMEKYIADNKIQLSADAPNLVVSGINLKLKELFAFIVECAIRTKDERKKKIALQICLYIQDLFNAEQLYEQLISLPKYSENEDLTEKKVLLEQFAEFCARNGLIEKAKSVLHQRISIEFESTLEVERIKEKRLSYVTDLNIFVEAEKENISISKVIREQDNKLKDIMEELSRHLEKESETLNSSLANPE